MRHNKLFLVFFLLTCLFSCTNHSTYYGSLVDEMDDSLRHKMRYDLYIESCEAAFSQNYSRSIALLDSALMLSSPDDTSCTTLTLLLSKQRDLLCDADTSSAFKVINQIDKLGFPEIADQRRCHIYMSQKNYREALKYVAKDAQGFPDKAIIYNGLKNVDQAIENAVLYLDSRGNNKFYEGSFECYDLYNILIKNCELSVSKLEKCLKKNPKNYQIRQVLMKMYLFELKNYDKVIEYGDWFRDEFHDYSDFDFGYNYWRQEALKIKNDNL